MMKRRWSNNGGFTSLRMLDDSSSEVTSSSAALVMSPGMTMSPTSLGSPEYNELELWGAYDENAYNGHSVLSNGNNNLGVGGGGGCGGGAGVTANQLLMNGIMHGTNNLNGMMNGIGIGPGIGGGGGGGGPGGGTVGVNGQPNGVGQPNSNQIQQFVGNLISGMNHSQTIIPPLPSIIQNTIMNTPRSESVNSISSGKHLSNQNDIQMKRIEALSIHYLVYRTLSRFIEQSYLLSQITVNVFFSEQIICKHLLSSQIDFKCPLYSLRGTTICSMLVEEA
uniref:Putative ecdysone receptor-like protein n=1 Tax=Anopheles darlingi TaxID=43151 RepID=A0A2M4CX70_ANODA